MGLSVLESKSYGREWMILAKLCFIFGDYNIVSRLSSKMAAFHPWQGWQYEKATKLAAPGSVGISPCISSCIAWECFTVLCLVQRLILTRAWLWIVFTEVFRDLDIIFTGCPILRWIKMNTHCLWLNPYSIYWGPHYCYYFPLAVLRLAITLSFIASYSHSHERVPQPSPFLLATEVK